MRLMKQNLFGRMDAKSVVIGLLLGLCVALGLAAAGDSGGRYQGVEARDGVFIIDTNTGQSWKLERAATIDFGTPTDRRSHRSYVTPTG